MTRSDFERYEAWLKDRDGPTVDVSFEVELDTGDYVEITELPGVEFNDEFEDGVEADYEALGRRGGLRGARAVPRDPAGRLRRCRIRGARGC